MKNRFLNRLPRKGLALALAVAAVAASAAFATPASAFADTIGTLSAEIGGVDSGTSRSYSNVKELLDDADALAKNSLVTKVIVDVEADWNIKDYGRIGIYTNSNYEFNLNGHMIDVGQAGSKSDDPWYGVTGGCAFYVYSRATLTINGGSDDASRATQHAGTLSDGGRFWSLASDGKDVINGGLITGGADDKSDDAGCISMAGANSKVYLNDVTLAGNVMDKYWLLTGSGGAIYMHDDSSLLELNNSKIVCNHAESEGGGIYVDGNKCTVNLKNGSAVDNNLAVSDGGGIYVDGNDVTLNIDNSSVSGNSSYGENGGGIYHNGKRGSVSLTGAAKVDSNSARYCGGGIYDNYDDTSFVLDGASSVSNNSSKGSGAGIYLNDVATLTLKGASKIDGNASGYNGGGVDVNDANTVIELYDKSTISGNSAQWCGGAIACDGRAGSVSLYGGSALNDNKATQGGGAIYNFGDGTFFYVGKECTIDGNKAFERGGAMYLADSSTVSFVQASISNNRASSEGGAIYAHDTVDIKLASGSKMNGNYSNDNGGAVCVDWTLFDDPSSISLVDSQMNGNMATNYGGCIYNASELAFKAENSTVNASKAQQGGAFYSKGNSMEVWFNKKSSAKENVASKGAVLYAANAGIKFGSEDGTGTFSYNTALSDGGVIYYINKAQNDLDSDTPPLFSGMTLSYNNARTGGAIWGLGSCVFERGTTITRNVATVRGGGVYLDGDAHEIAVGGKLTIENNLLNGEASDLDVGSGYKLAAADNHVPSKDGHIGIALASGTTGNVTIASSSFVEMVGKDNAKVAFFSDDPNRKIVESGGEFVSAQGASSYDVAVYSSAAKKTLVCEYGSVVAIDAADYAQDANPVECFEADGLDGVSKLVPDDQGKVTFKMPHNDVVLRACYAATAANTVALTVDELVAGESFPANIASCRITGTDSRDITGLVQRATKIVWVKADGSEVGDVVEGDTLYKATIEISDKEVSLILGLDGSANSTVNGMQTVHEDSDSGLPQDSIAFYERTGVDASFARLLNAPTVTHLDNVTDYQRALPGSAEYLLGDGTVLTADIAWDSIDEDAAQEAGVFDVTGRYADVYGASHKIICSFSTLEDVAEGASIEGATVSVAKKAAYSAAGVCPKVTVKLNGTKLEQGKDYLVKYVGNDEVGKAHVVIKGLGAYEGSVSASFKIVPAKVKGVAVKAAGKGKAKVSWTKHKAQTAGFEVRYGTNKAKVKVGKGVKTAKAKGAKATSKKLKGLKSGKSVYVQVRACKVVDGKTYRSAWSKVASVKVK